MTIDHSRHRWATLFLTLAALSTAALAIPPGEPVNGMRPATEGASAITGATVVIRPGEVLENATVVIRDGLIQAVGTDVDVPPGATIHDGTGLTVYPALIDAAVLVPAEDGDSGPGQHWNSMIRAERNLAQAPLPSAALRTALRETGFAVAAIHPESGILRGRGAVIGLRDDADPPLRYAAELPQVAGFDRARGQYPGSKMGAIALLRQTLLDAGWHAAARREARRDSHPAAPPVPAASLVALTKVVKGRQPILFETDDEHDALRAGAIAREFDLKLLLLGSGLEFRRLDAIAALDVTVIVPLEFPDRPLIDSVSAAEQTSLRDMMTWEQGPTNARRLEEAGVNLVLTTERMKKRGDFRERLALAIKAGLSPDTALAALTTRPAELLGLEGVIGTVEAGKAAHLVVVDGDLFDPDAPIRATWVGGVRYAVNEEDEPAVALAGTFTDPAGRQYDAEMDLDAGSFRMRARVEDTDDDAEGADADDDATADGTETEDEAAGEDHGADWQKAKSAAAVGDRLTVVIDAAPLGGTGYARLEGAVADGRFLGRIAMPDGSTWPVRIEPNPESVHEDAADDSNDAADDEVAADDSAAATQPDDPTDDEDDAYVLPPETYPVPLGAYGRFAPPVQRDVLFVNATIWTTTERGIINGGAMLVRDGRIAAIYDATPVTTPEGVERIDLEGRHLTPGLIDCHSHTGINAGINEFSQANTAEVRIGDVINPDDINWYRQLAGGLTAANQLHGSANPIGGQNSVVKIRWGAEAADFRIPDAKPGIKFALGENVVRSERRYPDTRMGVEAFFRDAFAAAQAYRSEHERYAALGRRERQATAPPRRDLEMDALVEILEGERIIHCHSYRQDEILMLIRVAESFGFTIGTFQHVLEGFKVADDIAAHGAGASSFSDWWAYKVEVMDAIPFNGAIMKDVGVLVSFNSDSSELARRMNTEASKAVRYGGVDPNAALAFVTANPAAQLGIGHRTGRLEAGYDADFAIWSGDPLSTYTRCDQTWIEGAQYFDRADEPERRAWIAAERQRLTRRILGDTHGPPPPAKPESVEDENPEQLAFYEHLFRLGEDPEAIRPGECGCGHGGHH